MKGNFWKWLNMRDNFTACLSLMLISIIFSPLPVVGQEIHSTENMPLIENHSEGKSNYYVILLSGNGGWRDLDKSLTAYLNSKNISVLGLNTKQYLLSEKKPEQIAFDLETLMDRYDFKWKHDKVVLIGYSMGAEILPFVVNRMDERYTKKIQNIILIGPWQKATFKVKLADYIYETNEGEEIYPELLKVKHINTYVICDDNEYALCLKPIDGKVDHDELSGGHHFGGDYDALSKLIGKRLKLE
jgi:type IV secretory pathway VirJ component